jgi:hypothetical protein
VLHDFDDDGSLDADDCAPSDASIHPGADDPYGDGIDQNCDGVDGNAVDLDGDGYSNAVDCDDSDPAIHPGAEDEPGDGIDSNCDDLDGVAVDLDGDGYSNAFDCDDSDPTSYPGAPDTEGDGIDQNCDGVDGVAPPGDDDDDSAGDDDDDSASGDDDDDSSGDDDTTSGDDDSAGDDDDLTNGPPGAPGVEVVPASPLSSDDLACVVQTESVDPDGDPVSYTFEWTQNATSTGITTPIVAASLTGGNDVWVCEVTPNDGNQDGTSGTASVTVTIPVGCWDGTVEVGGTAVWGRNDIVYCRHSTGFYQVPSIAEEACGYGWHICTGAEWVARNDNATNSPGTIFAVLDDGSHCRVAYSGVPGWELSSDWAAGSGTRGTANYCPSAVGFTSATPSTPTSMAYWGVNGAGESSCNYGPLIPGDCGVMCCYD